MKGRNVANVGVQLVLVSSAPPIYQDRTLLALADEDVSATDMERVIELVEAYTPPGLVCPFRL